MTNSMESARHGQKVEFHGLSSATHARHAVQISKSATRLVNTTNTLEPRGMRPQNRDVVYHGYRGAERQHGENNND